MSNGKRIAEMHGDTGQTLKQRTGVRHEIRGTNRTTRFSCSVDSRRGRFGLAARKTEILTPKRFRSHRRGVCLLSACCQTVSTENDNTGKDRGGSSLVPPDYTWCWVMYEKWKKHTRRFTNNNERKRKKKHDKNLSSDFAHPAECTSCRGRGKKWKKKKNK